ncbi:MAG: hypothetical protein JNM80_05355 [Phycisphaerae bacterium]|nr:hypothetical protein [Phycisphaerae bacterium]
MPCLLALIAFFFPRFVLIVLGVFTHYLGRAYDSAIWPILGFFFLPYTTLAYAYSINSNGRIDGLYVVLLIVAVLMDLGVIGGSAKASGMTRDPSR